jgi:predicted RNA methylase
LVLINDEIELRGELVEELQTCNAIAGFLHSFHKTKPGNKRKTGKEQYYTIPEISDFCVEKTRKYIKEDSIILEPAGGRGDFIESIKRAGFKNKIVSCDIEPKHKEVLKANFLESSGFITAAGFKVDDHYVTLTNPPFGRMSSLAVKFFNEAAKFSEVIGFIVPKAWKKWSLINRLDSSFHLIETYSLPEVCFYSEETGVYGKNLNTIFQIWKKGNEQRPKITIPDPELIKKTSPEDADVVLTTFGWGCGNVIEDFKRVKNTCYAFYKINGEKRKVIDALKEIDFSIFYNNVSYTQCLGIQEVNWCLNEYFGLPNLQGVDATYLPEKLLLGERNK